MSTSLSVLILEDREADARLMVHELTQAGFEPQWRRVDSEAGYLAALDSSLGVILADFDTPGWNTGAMEALTALQARGWDIPFIIVAGAISEEAVAETMRRGAADCLLKDHLVRLGTTVRQALERRRLREQARTLQIRLKEGEARFRALIENSWDVVGLLSARGTVLYNSPAIARVLGYTGEELVGRHALEFVHGDDQDAVQRQIARSVEQPDVSLYARARVRHKDHSFRQLEGLFTNRLHEPAVRAIIVNYRDITDRTHAESVLDEAKEGLQRAVTAGGVGLWDWDLRTNKVYFSPEWKRHIGYADHEISGDFNEWQSRVHPDDLDRALQSVQAYLSGAAPLYEVEFRFRHKDGTYRHILARGSKILGDDGTPARLLGSHVDITERTQLQAQFLQAQKMETVGRLAGGIAHDFNNILTVIKGTADLAMATLKEGDPLRMDLQEIQNVSDRAASLTRQLLAFSRKQIMKPSVLNLNTVIANLAEMLRRMIGEDIDLVFSPAKSLGHVSADAGQIEQVILNLIVNARDAMPNGGALTIETRDIQLDATHVIHLPSVQPGRYVMLAISDTGVGMDEATRRQIFEPFFTTKEVGKGTGLGLATVYGIVKQSGGSIWVYSERGTGTTFRIYLPQVEGPARPASLPQIVATKRGTETILVVEDEAGIRLVATRILRSAGYTVLTAADGDEALRLLERDKRPVHLLLTDVIMPDMNGRVLAARLWESRPHMEVLYTSGYTDDAILRTGVIEDSAYFIAKPYSQAELTHKVREVLDSSVRGAT